MDPDGVERKLAAILSADVAGYSHLMAQDEVATLRTLAADGNTPTANTVTLVQSGPGS